MVTSMTISEYRAAPGENFSTLKYMHISPFAYRDAKDNGVDDKPAWGLGRAAHTAFLEPYSWMDRYAIKPKTVERTVGKRDPKKVVVNINSKSPEFKEFAAKADAEGREIISRSDHDRAVAIAQAAILNRRVARLIRMKPQREVPVFWERLGIKMKSQLDLACPGKYLADLKSFGKAMNRVDSEVFHRDRLYCAQAAMYHDAWEYETGEDLPFIFIFVQSSRPYDVSVKQLSAEALLYGREVYTEWLVQLKECQRLDSWPGVDGDDDDKPLIVDLPAYLQDDEEIENDGYDWEESA